ncbi:hypothetical protein QCA50_007247 [Cerrena zonata]|uniref:NAD(P)-binding protein n=1 Tax=Cerrena zonata TaxID=2478898 RepID=A0AAW0GK30_9APHY
MSLFRAAKIQRRVGLSHLAPLSTSIPRRFSSSSTKDSVLNTNNQKMSGVQPAYGPLGVNAALKWSTKYPLPNPTLFPHEFSIADRVALVSGANRGIGLEMALALIEAGARAVYCVDLPKTPGEEWEKTRLYAEKMQGKGSEGRLEYIQGDVTNQEATWKIAETIGSREGRLDIGVAAAGVLKNHIDCLRYPAKEFQEVLSINVNGVLFTAQAAGQQMEKFGNGGSLILIASMSGSITNKDHSWVSYNTSKSAVLQMARSMACELAPKQIRVNTISPGYIYTRQVSLSSPAREK